MFLIAHPIYQVKEGDYINVGALVDKARAR